MKPYTKINSIDAAKRLLQGIDTILLDVDGVLVAGSRVLPGVPEALNQLRRHNKKLRVVTNNSTRPIKTIVHHFKHLGIPFQAEEIISSAAATADYLANICPSKPFEKGNVFLVGSPGLQQEIEAVLPKNRFVYGVSQLHPSSTHEFGDIIRTANLSKIAEAAVKRILPPVVSSSENSSSSTENSSELTKNQSIESLNISCVVTGLDPSFTLTKLCVANLCLRQKKSKNTNNNNNEKTLYVATNSDPQFPIAVVSNKEGGGKEQQEITEVLLPGGGTIVQAINTASGRVPDSEIGKPHKFMFDVIASREARKHQNENQNEKFSKQEFAKRCLMIGDRLTTDVLFGKRSGTKTMLVLTGCETEEDIEKTKIVPDYVGMSLGELGKYLANVDPVSKL